MNALSSVAAMRAVSAGSSKTNPINVPPARAAASIAVSRAGRGPTTRRIITSTFAIATSLEADADQRPVKVHEQIEDQQRDEIHDQAREDHVRNAQIARRVRNRVGGRSDRQ